MKNRKELSERIGAYLSSRREEIFGRLASLCRIPSVEGAPEKGKPFGVTVERAIKSALSFFCEEGFTPFADEEGRFALATLEGGGKRIGLFGHCDVVPAGDGWTVSGPYEPHRRDGFFFARGCEDNKGGIIAALYAMKAIKELSLPFSSTLVSFIGGNEETGMRDIEAFSKLFPMPDVSLVPDNDFPLSLGEKGRAEGWLVSPPLSSAILDFCGGECFNIVLDRVTVTLAYGEALYRELCEKKDPSVEYEVKRDKEHIFLTVRGIAAHASAPCGSKNAAERAAYLLSRCETLNESDRDIMAAASRLLSDPFGATLGIAGEDGGFGARTAACGMARLKDGCLTLSEDIRYGSATSWNTLSKTVGATLASYGWRFECGEATDGFELEENGPLSSALLRVYREESGDGEAMPYRSGGGTYARHLTNAYSVGLTCPVDRKKRTYPLPTGHGGVHQADECICEDEYLLAIRILTMMLLSLDEALQNEA